MNVDVRSEALRCMSQSNHKCIRDYVGHAEALEYVDVEDEASLEAVDLDIVAEEPKRYPKDSDMVQSFENSRSFPR